MATGQIGSNLTLNDFMHDASKHQAWNQNWSLASTTWGRMIEVDAFFAGHIAGSGGAAAWCDNQNPDTTGHGYQHGLPPTLYNFYTTTDTVGAGSGTGGAWHTTTSDVPTTSSDTWQFGGGASNGVWIPYHDNGGTTFVKASFVTDATSGTNVSTYTGRTGEMAAYGTYFILAFWIYRSGIFQQAPLQIARSAAIYVPKIAIYRSGTWIQVAELGRNIEFDPSREYTIMAQDEDGIWFKGIARWQGPCYLGPKWAREMQLYPRQAEERQHQSVLVRA
jgi:hypothetical protein